jgi:hypothetical protein
MGNYFKYLRCYLTPLIWGVGAKASKLDVTKTR